MRTFTIPYGSPSVKVALSHRDNGFEHPCGWSCKVETFIVEEVTLIWKMKKKKRYLI